MSSSYARPHHLSRSGSHLSRAEQVERRRDDCDASLTSTLRMLAASDEAGTRTVTKMHGQTEQLDRILDKTEGVHRTLEATDKTIRDMEAPWATRVKGWFRKSPAPTDDKQEGEITMQGYLGKRGENKRSAFHRRFCILRNNTLYYYDSERNTVLKGEIPLSRKSKVVRFGSREATGDALKHYRDHPFGFALYPQGAMSERMWFFDATDSTNLDRWVQALERANSYTPSPMTSFSERSAKEYMHLTSRQEDAQMTLESRKMREDAQLDMVDSFLDGLQEKALLIGSEAVKQSEKIQKVNDNVDVAKGRMTEQERRIKDMMK